MAKKLFLPIGLLIGTIIGAGIFSLPFVFQQSGIITGSLYLVFLTIIACIIHMMYADIIIRTGDGHRRFPGYVKLYLGKGAGIMTHLVIFLALFLTLTVYLILSTSFINLVAPGLPEIFKILIFWFLGSLAVFLAIKKAAIFESVTTAITLAVIFLVFIFGFLYHPAKILTFSMINPGFSFLPFGPILFSLLGESAIPALVVYLKEENIEPKRIKQILLWGTIIPSIFYLLFILGILGFSGNVTEDAISGLFNVAPPLLLFALGILGFVSLWDSYSSIGTDIKKVMQYEWKIPRLAINLLVIFLPLILYFAIQRNFLDLISLVGGILYSLWGILIILVWQKAVKIESETSIMKRLSPWIIYLLLFIFLAGIIYHIFHFAR